MWLKDRGGWKQKKAWEKVLFSYIYLFLVLHSYLHLLHNTPHLKCAKSKNLFHDFSFFLTFCPFFCMLCVLSLSNTYIEFYSDQWLFPKPLLFTRLMNCILCVIFPSASLCLTLFRSRIYIPWDTSWLWCVSFRSLCVCLDVWDDEQMSTDSLLLWCCLQMALV